MNEPAVIASVSTVIVLWLMTAGNSTLQTVIYQADAQISGTITVSTDKEYYYGFEDPVMLLISGSVGENVLREGEQVVIQVYNPNDVLYRVDFANVTTANGSYNYELKLGGIMAIAGEYRIMVTYRGQYQAESRFEFEGFPHSIRDPACQIHICTYELEISDITYSINYRMSGIINNITADIERKALVLNVTAFTNNTLLLLALPDDAIQAIEFDSSTGNKTNVMFTVLVDGEDLSIEAQVSEEDRESYLTYDVLGISSAPEKYRILGIVVERDSKQIEIIGTWIAPEFGPSIILTVSVSMFASVLAFQRFRKFDGN